MIIKIKFLDNDVKQFTMLFGDSYKKWYVQFEEYCRMFKPLVILEVHVSQANWKSWGGLKWCNENEFQHELNREGMQSGEPDNPKPRQYAAMDFYYSKHIFKKVLEISEKYK
jgi:hypothetical protein